MTKKDFVTRCNLVGMNSNSMEFVKFLKQQLNCSLKFAVDMMHDYYNTENSGNDIWSVIEQININTFKYEKKHGNGKLIEIRQYHYDDCLLNVEEFFKSKK